MDHMNSGGDKESKDLPDTEFFLLATGRGINIKAMGAPESIVGDVVKIIGDDVAKYLPLVKTHIVPSRVSKVPEEELVDPILSTVERHEMVQSLLGKTCIGSGLIKVPSREEERALFFTGFGLNIEQMRCPPDLVEEIRATIEPVIKYMPLNKTFIGPPSARPGGRYNPYGVMIDGDVERTAFGKTYIGP